MLSPRFSRERRHYHRLVVLALLLWVLAACQGAAAPDSPPADDTANTIYMPRLNPPANQYVLYEDSFRPARQDYWYHIGSVSTTRQWDGDNGLLRILPNSPDSPTEFITIFQPTQPAQFSAALRLDAEHSPDPRDAIGGLVLRYRFADNVHEYYVFGVELQTESWVFAYYREVGPAKERQIIQRGLLPDSEADWPTAEIDLTAWAAGSTYTLYVNGQQVAEVEHAQLDPSGHFGLIADDRQAGNVGFLFLGVQLAVIGDEALALNAQTPTAPPPVLAVADADITDLVRGAVDDLDAMLAAIAGQDDGVVNCQVYTTTFNGLLLVFNSAFTAPGVQNILEPVLSNGYQLNMACLNAGQPEAYTLAADSYQSRNQLGIDVPTAASALRDWLAAQ